MVRRSSTPVRSRVTSAPSQMPRLGMEPLESRHLLSASPQLLSDVNLFPATAPSYLTEVSGTVYFADARAGTGSGIWKTDGTEAGTSLVKAISPSVGNVAKDLIDVNGTLFFQARNVNGLLGLWKSDGTEAGTVMVKSIPHGSNGQNVAELDSLTNVGGRVFFTVTSPADSTNGSELWTSDGTSAGTLMVKDIRPGSSGSYPMEFTAVDNTLFFTADDGVHGREVWKSDGTTAGTVMVKDLDGGTSWPQYLTNVGGTLFFAGTENATGMELWKSDGTDAGTVVVADIIPGAISSVPSKLANVGGTLFFAANDGTHGTELWKSDGTAAGTTLVLDISPGSSGLGDPGPSLYNVGGTLYFRANDGTHGVEPWKSDGSAAGTVMVADIYPGNPGSSPLYFTAVGSSVLFAAAGSSATGDELWSTDGTPAGTSLVKDILPGSGHSHPGNLVSLGGTLIFRANDGSTGNQLWKSDGTQAGTEIIKFIDSSASSSANTFTEVGDTTFFVASSSANNAEIWKTDGTAAGTVLVKDVDPPGGSIWTPDNLTNVNGTLFFVHGDDVHGKELWKSDGTEAGTVLVKDITPGGGVFGPNNLTNVNGTLFFAANDGTGGFQLWKSDGTEAGTVELTNINPTNTSSGKLGLFVNFNGALLFVADDGINGSELWTSDGTPAGTVLLKDIRPGAGSSSPDLTRFAAIVGSTLYFRANDGASGNELWKTDGTTAGTELVKDLRSGSDSSDPAELTDISGTLFFKASDGTATRLWKSDGTTAGTTVVTTAVTPSPNTSTTLKNFANVGGTLFFAGTTSSTDRELWKSDGTAAGTVRVKDISPGTGASNAKSLVNLNGTLYFLASDPTHGEELWKSDGTEAGTVVAADLVPGTTGSGIDKMAVSNHALFFQADDGVHGAEPWIVPYVPPSVVDTHLFYKGSPKWNVTNAKLPGYSDDNAIAPDKSAYLGTGSATFSSVSSYTRGINGVMVDIAGDHGTLTTADFTFKVGNNNSPESWAAAPAPIAITVRGGAGPAGSDRVEILWADNAIQGQWLEVILEGDDDAGGFNTNTGLTASYVFYYGSAPADSGAGDAMAFLVNSADESSARNDPHGPGNPASIANANDFNRDGLVNGVDQSAARNMATNPANALQILSLGGGFAPLVETAPTSSAIAAGERGIASALSAQASPPAIAPSAQSVPWVRTGDPAVAAATHASALLSLDDAYDEPAALDQFDDDLLAALAAATAGA